MTTFNESSNFIHAARIARAARCGALVRQAVGSLCAKALVVAAPAMIGVMLVSMNSPALGQQFRAPTIPAQSYGNANPNGNPNAMGNGNRGGGFSTYPSSIPSIPQAASGQSPAPEDADGEASDGDGSWVPKWMLQIKTQLAAGGWLMFPLGLCSLIVVTLVAERLISMRRGRVIPRPFVRRFREKVEEGHLDLDEAIEVCDEFDCPVADVFLVAVKRSGRPMVEIEAAVFDALERTANELRRYLRMFHAISNVAPLIGLLGTVLGMIDAFDTMASQAGVGRPELLASGISQALVTTAGGLCVAIPAYLAYMYFSSRADRYLAEVEQLSLAVIDAVSAENLTSTSKTRRKRAA